MAVNLNGNEEEQILQTIEMFEVITRANPDDYQSLDLLREAYLKLDRLDDVIRVSQMLATAYERSGQISAALDECDFILARNPSQEGVTELRRKIASSLGASETSVPAPASNKAGGKTATSSLISIDRTRSGSPALDHPLELPEDDGNDALARFLHTHQLVSQEEIDTTLMRVRMHNGKRAPNTLALSLLEETVKQTNVADEEDIYAAILEHTRMGFMPLEHYEVDRQIVRMLPEEYTLGRLLVPFDLISRTLMIATCNPLDTGGREVVQQSLDYNIQWYFVSPKALRTCLRETFRISET